MKRALLLVLGALLIPAHASAAVTVSSEAQKQMHAAGYSAGGEMVVTPLLTKQAGDRECKRVRSRTVIWENPAHTNALMQDWASVGGCLTQTGQVRVIGVGHGQGSSGIGWERCSPWTAYWLGDGWVANRRHEAYWSRTRVMFYRPCGGPNGYTLTANAQLAVDHNGTPNKIGDDRLRGNRSGHIAA